MKENEDSEHGFPTHGRRSHLLCMYCSKNCAPIYAVRYNTYFSASSK